MATFNTVITCLQDLNDTEHNHWVKPVVGLPDRQGYAPCWDLWEDARYPVTNIDHTGRRAVVHAVDPADLRLSPRPDGRKIFLYAYEGEKLCSILEGNGFCFPGSDLFSSFLHCQGDEILSLEQNTLGVYFPFFPHEDTLIEEETSIVPSRELNIMGVDPLKVQAWEESPWFCRHWDVPRISEWNECMDQMWRSAWHKKNDELLKILKQCAEEPLLERILELEVDLENSNQEAAEYRALIEWRAEPSGSSDTTVSSVRGWSAWSTPPPEPLLRQSPTPAEMRDAALAEEARPQPALPSKKRRRSTEPGPPRRSKHLRCVAAPRSARNKLLT